MDSGSKHLLRNSGALFTTLLVIGIPLPVLPLYIHNTLGYSNAMVGVAIGTHFLVNVLCRGLAGRCCDTYGARPATLAGIFACSLSGLPYLCMTLPFWSDGELFAVILVSRVFLGIGHSLLGTGNLAWGFGLVPGHAGRVMSWAGICIYAALAAGAPLGLYMWDHWGMLSLGVATTVFPLLGFLFVARTPATPVLPGKRVGLWEVFKRIWRFGVCIALQAAGFSTISAFITLHFAARGWENAGLALTGFGVGFILSRLVGGELPDKSDCHKLTLYCLGGQAVGLALLCVGTAPWHAFTGVFLAGLSCSLFFPSIGVQVLRDVPAHVRGTAIAGTITFADASMGFAAPLTGLLVPFFGYPAVYFAVTCAAAVAFCMAWRLPSTR